MYFGLFVPVPGRGRGERTFSSFRNKYDPFRLQISFSHLVHITYRCFIFLDAFAVSEKIKARLRVEPWKIWCSLWQGFLGGTGTREGGNRCAWMLVPPLPWVPGFLALCLPHPAVCVLHTSTTIIRLPGGLAVKNPPANAGDAGSFPGLERSPREGNGYLLKYSCLGNPMDRGAWRTTVHGVAKTRTRLSG